MKEFTLELIITTKKKFGTKVQTSLIMGNKHNIDIKTKNKETYRKKMIVKD